MSAGPVVKTRGSAVVWKGELAMPIAVEESGAVRIVRVKEAKLTYAVLGRFFADVQQLVESGARRVLLDLREVTYMDSASIGCLMDIQRLLRGRKGLFGICAMQPRVETMISMTGVLNLIDAYADEAGALAALSSGAEPGD
jgi:anti-sigma B factor antagonist